MKRILKLNTKLLLLLLFFSISNVVKGQIEVSGSNGADNTYTVASGLRAAFAAINAQDQTGRNIEIRLTESFSIPGGANQPILNGGNWESLVIYPTVPMTLTIANTAVSPVFNAVSNVTIDGRVNREGDAIGLNIVTAQTGEAIVFRNSTSGYASGNTVRYCDILGTAQTSGVIVFDTGVHQNYVIENCKIHGQAGTTITSSPQYLIYAKPASYVKTITIRNNELYDVFSLTQTSQTKTYAAISDQANTNPEASTGDGWNILNNLFYETGIIQYSAKGYTLNWTCIDLRLNNDAAHVIRGNQLGGVGDSDGHFEVLSGQGSGNSADSRHTMSFIKVGAAAIAASGYSQTVQINNNSILNIALESAGVFLKMIEAYAPKLQVENNRLENVEISTWARSKDDLSVNGILLQGREVSVNGNYIQNLLITGHQTSDCSTELIRVDGVGTEAIAFVRNNQFYNNSYTTTSNSGTVRYRGIQVANSGGEIAGNQLLSPLFTTGGSIDFVPLTTGGCNVYNNFLRENLGFAPTGTILTYTGILISEPGVELYNNVVRMGGSSNDAIRIRAIDAAVNWSRMYHNTVVLTGPNGNQGGGVSYALYISNPSFDPAQNELKNNILWNKRAGTTFGGTAVPVGAQFDYNDYGYVSALGMTPPTADVNSVLNIDPLFRNINGVSAVDFNVNNPNGGAVHPLAIAPLLPGYENDFGNSLRPMTEVTLGAWEATERKYVVVSGTNTPADGEYDQLNLAFYAINQNSTNIASAADVQVHIYSNITEGAPAILQPLTSTTPWNTLEVWPVGTITVTSDNTADAMVSIRAERVKISGRYDDNPEQEVNMPLLAFRGGNNKLIELDGASGATISSLELAGLENNMGDIVQRPSYAIYAANCGTTDGIRIRANYIYGGLSSENETGAYIHVEETDNCTIDANHIFEKGTLNFGGVFISDASYKFIEVLNTTNTIVSDNYLGGTAPRAGGTPMNKTGGDASFLGIYVKGRDGGSNNEIADNLITNIDWVNAGSPEEGEGELYCILAQDGNFTISNNQIGSRIYEPSEEDPEDPVVEPLAEQTIQFTNGKNFHGIYLDGKGIIRNNNFQRAINISDISDRQYTTTAITVEARGETLIEDNRLISQDIIGETGSVITVYGIKVDNHSPDTITICGNQINAPESIMFTDNDAEGNLSGIGVTMADNTAGPVNIYTNLLVGDAPIEVERPLNIHVFEIENKNSVNIYHNTASLRNVTMSSSTIYHGSTYPGATIDIRNNVFVNQNPGGTILELTLYEGAETPLIDFNNVFCDNELGFINKVDAGGDSIVSHYASLDEWAEAVQRGFYNRAEDMRFNRESDIPAERYILRTFLGGSMDEKITNMVIADFDKLPYEVESTEPIAYRMMGAFNRAPHISWRGNQQQSWSGTTIYTEPGGANPKPDGDITYGGWRLTNGRGQEPYNWMPPFEFLMEPNDTTINIVFSRTVNDLILDRDVTVRDVYIANGRGIYLNGYTLTVTGRLVLQNGSWINAEDRDVEAPVGGIVPSPAGKHSTLILNSEILPEGARIQRIAPNIFVNNVLPELIIQNNSEFYAALHSDLEINKLSIGLDKPLNASTYQPHLTFTNWDNAQSFPAQEIPNNAFFDHKVYQLTIDNDIITQTDTLIVETDMDITAGSKYTIPAAKHTEVKGMMTNEAGIAGLLIGSQADKPNATFVFYNDTETNPVEATVQMYSKAKQLTEAEGATPGYTYRWQYFTVPVKEILLSDAFSGSTVREWYSAGTGESGSAPEVTDNYYWQATDAATVLEAFTGYEVTRKTQYTYSIPGELVNRSYNTELVYYPEAAYEGQLIIGNPYTTAIPIRDDIITMGAGLEQSIYMFNTGTYTEWEQGNNTGVEADQTGNPGQYTVVPINWAGQDGLPGQIPSMQGFNILINDDTEGADYSFGIKYPGGEDNSKNTVQQRTASVNKTTKVLIRVYMESEHFKDQMWLYVGEQFTRAFDNGWDGRKSLNASGGAQIFSVEGRTEFYQVNSIDDLNGSYLGFKPNAADDEYTLRFEHYNTEKLYETVTLTDLKLNIITDITASGSTYTFTSNTPDWEKRFIIKATEVEEIDEPTVQVDTSEKGIEVYTNQNDIIIENHGNTGGLMYVYDISGNCVRSGAFGPGTTRIYTDLKGMYIIKAYTKIETTISKVLLF